MSNFTDSVAATSHKKLNFVIIFEKLFDVISSCKDLYISKFSLKTAAAKTSRENSLLTSANPYFYVHVTHEAKFCHNLSKTVSRHFVL